jgi:multiple sugar transport system substrate-binding protein
MSFDPVYAPFGKVAAERTFSPEVLGVKDALSTQIRNASFKVGKGQITIEEAIAKYGKL